MQASARVRRQREVDVGEAAKRRVDETIDRIRRSGAYAGPQLLRTAAAAERTAARVAAERLAAGSGRADVVADGRDAVRASLSRRYAQFNLGMYYGVSADPSTARDRIEIALALEDLVLAVAVEDLLPPEDYTALATDGENLLLDIPTRSSFPSVTYAPADEREGSSGRSVRVMQVAVVALLIAGSLVAGVLFGLVPALFGGCLVASIVASWMWRRDRPEPQEREAP